MAQRLGGQVLFSHHHERTAKEHLDDKMHSDLDGRITYGDPVYGYVPGTEVRLEPMPNEDKRDTPATIIGTTRRPVRGLAAEQGIQWDPHSCRTFYVLRYTLRGRTYLVLPEHMTPYPTAPTNTT